MASVHVSIPDMALAIADGTVAGSFSADRTAYAFPTVRTATGRGATNLWTVRVRLLDADGSAIPMLVDYLQSAAILPAGFRGEITVEAQQEGGKIRDAVPTLVDRGKNAGRTNATNALSQAFRDALGMYNRYTKRSRRAAAPALPVAFIREESDGITELLRPPPMLIKKEGETASSTITQDDFDRGVTAQRKYNGVRLVARPVFSSPDRATAAPAAVELYSGRTQNIYPGLEHIKRELLELFSAEADEARPEDSPVYLDGEAYVHGRPLNWISGQARKSTPAGSDDRLLDYYVFDCFFPGAPDRPSSARQRYLDGIFARSGSSSSHVFRVENFPAADQDQVDELLAMSIRECYEGLVLRKDWEAYEYSYNNHHSSNAVKIKPTHDDEFPVVGYTEGKGKDKGAVIWVCEVPMIPTERTPFRGEQTGAARFSVVPKDISNADRRRLFQCLGELVPTAGRPVTRFERDFAGKPITVEYAELSKTTGKPLQPKASAFRTYEDGPEGDPVARAFAECFAVRTSPRETL